MSRIKELLNDPESVLVFDVDGVLAVMEWGEYNHYIDNDENWSQMYEDGKNFYDESKVIRKMQKFLSGKNMNRVYACSRVFNTHEDEDKKQFLTNYYGFKKDNVLSVRNNKDKIDVITKIRKMYPDLDDHHIIMIDDTAEVLSLIMNNTPFTTVHVSSFVDM